MKGFPGSPVSLSGPALAVSQAGSQPSKVYLSLPSKVRNVKLVIAVCMYLRCNTMTDIYCSADMSVSWSFSMPVRVYHLEMSSSVLLVASEHIQLPRVEFGSVHEQQKVARTAGKVGP